MKKTRTTTTTTNQQRWHFGLDGGTTTAQEPCILCIWKWKRRGGKLMTGAQWKWGDCRRCGGRSKRGSEGSEYILCALCMLHKIITSPIWNMESIYIYIYFCGEIVCKKDEGGERCVWIQSKFSRVTDVNRIWMCFSFSFFIRQERKQTVLLPLEMWVKFFFFPLGEDVRP